MQFAVLVYEKPGTYEALSAAELEQMTAEYFAIAELPGYIGGARFVFVLVVLHQGTV